MKIVMMGNIGSQSIMDDLPETGIVIQATREELQALQLRVYQNVNLVSPDGCENLRSALYGIASELRQLEYMSRISGDRGIKASEIANIATRIEDMNLARKGGQS